VAALAAACDFGTPTWEPSFGTGAPIHLVNQNVGPNRPITPGAPIELFFDRLLLPDSVTRQSFVLTDLNGNGYDIPSIVYDPVARSVAMQTLAPLPACQNFRVYLLTPAESGGLGGLQAIDGATLDPSTPQFVEFPVTGTCATGGSQGDGGSDGGADAGPDAGDAGAAPASPEFPTIDFCGTVMPIFRSNCTGSSCHGGASPAAGLRLDTSQGVVDTAVNRVSVESNQGPRSISEPASELFGLDMPVVDSSGGQGNPANSWLVYKLLLATPPASTPTSNLHSRPWSDLSAAERATLGNYVIGREMPFPQLAAGGSSTGTTLTLDQIEQISFWIQQGAPVPPCAP
jgi:hypothetical protein